MSNQNEEDPECKDPSRLQLFALASTLIIMIIFIAWLSNSGYEPKGAEENDDHKSSKPSRSDESEEEEGNRGIPGGGVCGVVIVVLMYYLWDKSEGGR